MPAISPEKRHPIHRSVRAVANGLSRIRLTLVISLLSILAASATAEPPEGVDVPSNIFDRNTRSDANQLDMWVTNHGSFGYDIETGNPGLIYPKGSNAAALFAGGLWMGARVNGETRVTVSEYSWEFQPGRFYFSGSWDDPNAPEYRVYKIQPGDTPESNPDYDEWPVDQGAPVDANGDPRHLGTQTLWSVFHDGNPNSHTNDAGRTNPLEVEVQQTFFALDQPGAAGTTIFMEYTITNRGVETLTDTYVSLWGDADIGGPVDDLVGSSPDLSLGYCYNATNHDPLYGSSPPALGFQMVQGPIVPSAGEEAYVSGEVIPDFRNLPMTAFNKYINGTDPSQASESYNYMQGLNSDGSSIIDPTTGQETTYFHSGDPLTGDGWIDSNPADRRMMISAGPFDMAPGEVQVVVAAVIVGQGNDRLLSIDALRGHGAHTPGLFREIVEDAEGACCFSTGDCVVIQRSLCTGDFSLDQPCPPDPCEFAAGACCLDNGTCSMLTADDCSGSYLGDGSVCTPGLCPAYGGDAACCFDAGVCEILRETDCLEAGGTYLADKGCALTPPGAPPGWTRNINGSLMIDEVAGPGGVDVPADGKGGPGDHVWHSYNSTREWILSAGGGDGGEDRFTRDGANLEKLTPADVVLKWDNHPDNWGWWGFDQNETSQIPFGLYLLDPNTGEETRLIAFFYSGGGTPGVYEISIDTPDGWQDWPATDWCYAYTTEDYDAFLADAIDGTIENADHAHDELFARLVFASQDMTLPAIGTEILFVTNDSGIEAGDGFHGAVPLAWSRPETLTPCLETPEYEIWRNGDLIVTTDRADYLDIVPNGEEYEYRIATKNPFTGASSALSVGTVVSTRAGGYTANSQWIPSGPTIDGVLDPTEWEDAVVIDARSALTGAPATLYLMNTHDQLFIGLEDGLSAADFFVYFDMDGNGSFGNGDGSIRLDHGILRYAELAGSYPNVVVTEESVDPDWGDAAATDLAVEMRIDLDSGPFENIPESQIVKLFFHSAEGSGQFPRGPVEVIAQAPRLFAAVQLNHRGPPAISIRKSRKEEYEEMSLSSPAELPQVVVSTALGVPNPFRESTTILYQVPSSQNVSVTVFAVGGNVVRTLAGNARVEAGLNSVVWDGRDDRGNVMSSGIYYYEVRGESFEWKKRLTLIR